MHFPQSTHLRDSCLFSDGRGLFFLALAIFSLAGSRLPAAAEGKLEVTYFDVGQADAVLVSCPEGKHHLLIDSGDTRYPKSSANFRRFLTNAFTHLPRHLAVVVASHQHADHIGSMEWVLKNFQVDTYVDNGDTGDTTTFANLQAERRRQERAGKLTYIKGKDNNFSEVDFCPKVKMEIFLPWATRPALADQNDRSVAVRLEYGTPTDGTNSFLFVGDIEGEAEQVMLNQFTEAQRAKLNADVLKVGHHGSDTSSRDGFVPAVSPQLAVVSVGKKDTGTNERYKHPRLSTLREYDTWFKNNPPLPPLKAPAAKIPAYNADTGEWKLQSRPAGLWLTVKDGTITVTAEGGKLGISAVPTQN